MKASELRVGNWVNHTSLQEHYQVNSPTIASIERGEDICEPIPLTNKWLAHFGFELVEMHASISHTTNDIPSHTKYASNTIPLITRIFIDSEQTYCYLKFEGKEIFLKKISSVHELQNLIFSLFNVEVSEMQSHLEKEF